MENPIFESKYKFSGANLTIFLQITAKNLYEKSVLAFGCLFEKRRENPGDISFPFISESDALEC